LFREHLLKPRSEKLEGSSIEVGFFVLGSTGGGLLPFRKFYGGKRNREGGIWVVRSVTITRIGLRDVRRKGDGVA
jgi:hypothetical protein